MAYLRAISVPTVDSNDIDGVRATFVANRRKGAEEKAFVGVALGLVAVLGTRSADEISALAGRTWARLYGSELLDLAPEE